MADAAGPPERAPLGTDDLGFLLAVASQRWNQLLAERFAAAGFADVRPSYGAVLLPLFEADGARIGDVGRAARLPKQTMTTLVRAMERDGLVERRPDPDDGRAARLFLTERARAFGPVAERAVAELDALVRDAIGRDERDRTRAALSALAALGEGAPARTAR